MRAAAAQDYAPWDVSFGGLMEAVRHRVLPIAGVTEATHAALPLQGCGHFAIEAAIRTFVPAGGRLLIPAVGEYGDRAARLAREAGYDVATLAVPADARVDPDAFATALEADPAIGHVVLVYSETATGVIHDIPALAAIAGRLGRRVIVDAVSAFGALPLDLSALPMVDAAVFTANKCLEGLPGVAFVIAPVDRLDACKDRARSWSLDLAAIHQHAVRTGTGWSRFTPPAPGAGRVQRGAGPVRGGGRPSGAAGALHREHAGADRRVAGGWACPCACRRPCRDRSWSTPTRRPTRAWDLKAFVEAVKRPRLPDQQLPQHRLSQLPRRLHRRRHAGRHGPGGGGDGRRDGRDGPAQPEGGLMQTDLEIAQAATLQPIAAIAARAGIPADALEPYGRTKAKVGFEFIRTQDARPDGHLVLVTGISPTPAGEGKTTTTIGLGDALNRIGTRAMICLREPSLGPCFGTKGGATGGGHAQVVPMADINLHFTGDFHAITAANNLLAAMLDNHIYWGNALGIDPRRVTWRRALDANDRALRGIVNGLGGVANGAPREDGFDITVASEVMAVFCLARGPGGPAGPVGPHGRRHPARRQRRHRARPAGGRCDGRPAAGRAGAEPGADAGGLARLGAWRPVRQHRPWLQLGGGDAAGAEAGGCGGDGGGVRRRPGWREVPGHQVPQRRAVAGVLRGGGDDPRVEDARRRAQGGAGARGRGRAGCPDCRTWCGMWRTWASSACPWWWR